MNNISPLLCTLTVSLPVEIILLTHQDQQGGGAILKLDLLRFRPVNGTISSDQH